MFGEHPLHLFPQRVARATSSESPAEPSEAIESSTVPSFDALETETDGVAPRRNAQNETLLCHRRRGRFGRVVWDGEKLGRVGWMCRVWRRWLERVGVHEGCERDRCDARKGAPVACLGLVGDGETRLGKREKPVAEHVPDRRDDT